MSPQVVVVGGGITGLTAAYRLQQAGVDVVVLEQDDEPGGKVRAAEVGGVRLEAGPDSLLARKPWAVDLARELGAGDLVPAAAAATHIWTRAGLLRFPSGPFGISTEPMELWRWKGMSYRGKLRAGGDLVLPRRRADGDESLGSLLRRRIGNEATDTLVAPLLGGLFAGDVDRLSVAATFPELGAWEREHRSLMLGARAMQASRRPATVSAPEREDAGRPAPPPMFVRLRGGLTRLTDGLADALGTERVRASTAVRGVARDDDRYTVRTDDGALDADAVIVTAPTFVATELLAEVAPEAAGLLGGVSYVSTAVALLVYPEGTDHALPASSGFVAPRGALPMNAATVVSKKWPDPSFGDRAVVRCFIGGTGTEDTLARGDDELMRAAAEALAGIWPLPAAPEASALVRWPRAMPQYEVGHLERVAAIEAALPPGLLVAGQAYRGAGLPDCVRQGNEAAERAR
ncbi:MAG: protoporphyrinogen oxidase, partial [Actinomycetota bacterium]